MILSIFAERLDELMFDNNVTSQQLAKAVGLQIPTITRYLRAERTPSVESLVKLADYFHCSCEFLLGRIDEDYPTAFYPCPPFTEQLKVLKNHLKCPWMELYNKSNISSSRFYEWKNGKRLPSLDCIVMLADGFDCSVDFIIGRTKD